MKHDELTHPLKGAFFLKDSVQVNGGLIDVSEFTDIKGQHPVLVLTMPMDVGVSTIQLIFGSPGAFKTFMLGLAEMHLASSFRDDLAQIEINTDTGRVRYTGEELHKGQSEASDSGMQHN